jgi:sec-independent protein translocase protein TatB
VLFDIGPGEFLVIAVVAVLIVGPERLPKMMAEGLKWLRVLRAQATNARRELAAAADLDPALTDELRRSMSDIAELHPRRIAASFLDDATSSPAPPADVPPARGTVNPAAFDPDAT